MRTIQPLTDVDTGAVGATERNAVSRHIRGSGLLLIGRLFALGLDFITGILMVHYLTKADYGALSYALSVVTFLQGIAMFELAGTLARFVPLYRERQQDSTVLGAIVLAFGFVLGFGVLLTGVLGVGVSLAGWRLTMDPQALQLLVVVAVLIPLEGVDGLFTTVFAIFGSSRTILLRQSILGPGLKLGLVASLIALRANVVFLAFGYVIISVIGVILYGYMFGHLLHRQGLLTGGRSRPFSYPARELFGFATPMLASRLATLLRGSSDVLLLGFFQGTVVVASFRAVLPVAELNQLVILAFTVLYTPLAARLYARNERADLAHLYQQTALWMTVLSFPIFVLTFSFARALTLGIFGPRYGDSAPILMLLSLGYFFHTILGFNGLTLKIFRRVRYTVSIDISAAALNIAINLLLIPRWGALGAAAGTTGGLIVHNLLKEFGLWKYTGITVFERQHLLLYSVLLGLPIALLGAQFLLPVSLWIALPLDAAATMLVLWHTRRVLQIATVFPELRQWPIMRTLWQFIDERR